MLAAHNTAVGPYLQRSEGPAFPSQSQNSTQQAPFVIAISNSYASPRRFLKEVHDYPPGAEANQQVRVQDTRIFKLLKCFKLQQYARAFADKGYNEDVYKLALLNKEKREELINSLKVLPGHNGKLHAFFEVIEHMYPRDAVGKQIRFAAAHANSTAPPTSHHLPNQASTSTNATSYSALHASHGGHSGHGHANLHGNHNAH